MYAKLKGVTLRGNFSKHNNIPSYNIKLNLAAKTYLNFVLFKDLQDLKILILIIILNLQNLKHDF